MESNQETIGDDYIIIDKIGKGTFANVFLVKDRNNENNLYAAKVLKKPSPYFMQEKKILNILKPINNPYIINIETSGEGLVIRENHPQQKCQYIILEYAPKGELYNYIYCLKEGLGERLGKLFFFKLLKGIQACHEAGICHRDIKMQNIILDQNFFPKICDFGFATQNNGHLTEFLGTKNYAAPEIFNNSPYDGFLADIFSLGVVLINLITGKPGFFKAISSDSYYNLIMLKNIHKYWSIVERQIPGLSSEFKKLFIKMVAYDPKERSTLKEIFESDWMKEIKEMKEEQLKQLEEELQEEFLKREPAVKETLIKKMELVQSDDSSGNRGTNDEKEFFPLELAPKFAKSGINMKNYIKLKGKLDPTKFMNSLANKIEKEFEEICIIEANKEKLKFNVTFEEQENDEEIPQEIIEELKKLGIKEIEEKDENPNIKGNDTVIQIKMYESFNEGYLLRFVKKEGDPKQYIEKMKEIFSLIKNM